MVIADPALTTEDGPRAGQVPREPARRRLLHGPRAAARRGQPLSSTSPARSPRPVPRRVVDAARERGFDGLTTSRDPIRTYPAGDVAANLVGFVGTPDPEEGDQPLAGLELAFDRVLSGTDGSARYQVGAGNRIPLAESTTVDAVDGGDLHHDHRPRPAVVRPAGAAPDRRGLRRASPASRSSWTRAPATCSRSPTTRRSTPTSRPSRDKDDRISRALTDVYEPGSVREGADPRLPDRRGEGHPAHPDHGAADR